MPIERRTRYNTQAGALGSGAYLATVIDVLDPTFNGRLKISLLRDQGNAGNTDGQTYGEALSASREPSLRCLLPD